MEKEQTEQIQQTEQKQPLHYDAFISYRHLEPDEFAAERLHKKLESFRLMNSVAKKHPELPKKIQRVFRDQEELPLASNLADPITEALINSDNLIVICTPKLKESRWCLQEIATFIQYHGREHIYTALVEGEPADSFPEILLHDENGNPVEPLAADFRGKNHKEIAKKIDEEVLRLIAPMMGLNYDDLKQRHREQKMKRTLTLGGILLALSTIMGVYYGVTAYHIQKQANQIAEQNSQIMAQNDQILEMSDELKVQYKEALKRYEMSIAGTIEKMMQDGRRNDSLYVLTSVMPEQKDDEEIPYCSNAEYILSQSCNIYGDDNVYSPSINYEADGLLKDMVMSPSGDKLAALSENGILHIWQAETGEKITEIFLDYSAKNKYVFISDQELLMIAKGSLIKLNLDTMEENTLVEGSFIGNLTWNNSRTIVAADLSNGISFYDVAAGKIICSVEKDKEARKSTFSKAIMNQDGSVYFVLEYEYPESGNVLSLTARSTSTGEEISKVSFDADTAVTDLCCEGDIVYLTGFTGKLKFAENDFRGFYKKYDYTTGKIVLYVPLLELGLNHMRYTSLDEKEYIVGTTYNKAYVLNANTGEITLLSSFEKKVVDCFLTVNGDVAAIVLENGVIDYWLLKNDVLYEYFPHNFENSGTISDVIIRGTTVYFNKKNEAYITKHVRAMSDNMEEFAKTPGGDYFFGNGNIFLTYDDAREKLTAYKTVDQTELYSLDADDMKVSLIGEGEGGILMYTGSTFSNSYQVYDGKTGDKLQSGEVDYIYQCNNYGNVLLIKNSDQVVQAVDVLTGEKVDFAGVDEYSIMTDKTDVAQDLSSLATAEGNILYVFSKGENAQKKQATLQSGLVSDLFYSSDSKYICVLYGNDNMEIFDAKSLESVSSLYGDILFLKHMTYIPEKKDYLLVGTGGFLVNENLEKIAKFAKVSGYDFENQKLVFKNKDIILKSNILDYEEVVSRAKSILGDYKAPNWIYQRYSISAD